MYAAAPMWRSRDNLQKSVHAHHVSPGIQTRLKFGYKHPGPLSYVAGPLQLALSVWLGWPVSPWIYLSLPLTSLPPPHSIVSTCGQG